MKFIWATRGRSWGTRFLRDGDFDDPLPIYELAFANLDGAFAAWGRSDGMTALRFIDPEGRTDVSGRPILHEFVLFPPESESVSSLQEGREAVWPEVEEDYRRWWNSEGPPASA